MEGVITMKKIISILLVFCMMLTVLPVFADQEPASAADSTQTTTDTSTGSSSEAQSTDVSTPAGSTVTVEEIEEVIGAEQQEDTLTQDEEEIVNELDDTADIKKADVTRVLKKMYTYLLKRDLYYKHILQVLNKIENSSNKELKLKAIVEFEKRYNNQKELDRKLHQKIEKVIELLKANKDEFTRAEKVTITRVFKPLLQKYYKHRSTIIYIHKKINAIKELSLKDEVLKLSAQADKLKDNKQYLQAAKLYEQALETGVADAATLKKAGQVIKQAEGAGPKVFVGGKRPAFDVKPKLINGRTMVPFRAIANSLGVNDNNITWNANTKTITLKKGDKTVELTIGQKSVRVNGKSIAVDVPATIDNGRTLVPARVVSEALDAAVGYDAETEVVTIEDSFGTAEQNIDVTEANDTGMGDLEQSEANVSEQQAVNDVTSASEATVESEVNGIE